MIYRVLNKIFKEITTKPWKYFMANPLSFVKTFLAHPLATDTYYLIYMSFVTSIAIQ